MRTNWLRGTTLGVTCGVLSLALMAASPAFAQSAVLRGLDKRTGQSRDFVAPLDKTVKFGTLEITARSCRKAAPEETPEVAIYLEVVDKPVPRRVDEETQRVGMLSGWIFASSPALNALEHATYDVWAIDCRA